jgi:transposase
MTKDNTRESRGRLIAAQSNILRHGMRWIVPSQTGGKTYVVDIEADPATCSCPDYELHGGPCKHIYAVGFMLRGEVRKGDASDAERAPRPTYRQDWTAYNAAQTQEKRLFQALLHDLCSSIEEPAKQGRGRPRVPLGDLLFAAAFKVYSTVSGRRFSCDLAEAHAKGYLSHLPHYNSVFRAFEDERLTAIFHALIERSALPLKCVETTFAVDSSGFSTATYTRWYSVKYGREMEAHDWRKLHLVCGTTTNIVTSVEVTGRDVGDTTMFQPLVQATARQFDIEHVVADKAYSTRGNLEFVERVGGAPFIPFKSNVTARTGGSETWERLFYYYQFRREEFLQHYHRRSLAESTFFMIQAKFGTMMRSKTESAQTNELLCKVLCHNICVLIQSMYELGIEADFGV